MQKNNIIVVSTVHSEQLYAPSPPDQGPQYCTVFNHMVKSGGTTIKTQLEQSSEVEGDAFPGACRPGGIPTASSDAADLYMHKIAFRSLLQGFP